MIHCKEERKERREGEKELKEGGRDGQREGGLERGREEGKREGRKGGEREGRKGERWREGSSLLFSRKKKRERGEDSNFHPEFCHFVESDHILSDSQHLITFPF